MHRNINRNEPIHLALADRRLRKGKRAAAILFTAMLISTGPIGLSEALADLLPPHVKTRQEQIRKQHMRSDLCTAISSRTSSFDESPFDDLDALVLSTAAYINFEKTSINDENTTSFAVSDIASFATTDDLLAKSWLYSFYGADFIEALSSSPRYKDVYVVDYVNDISVSDTYQFCAVTFKIAHNCGTDDIFVAFRGTDNSITGWKEDADATYLESTASQKMALDYIEDTASKHLDANIVVGGHSKGGNIAEYAASLCSEDTWNALDAVYNFDGPGFVISPQGRFDTAPYNAKVHKVLPESSVFGRLFENRSTDNFTIVRANGNPFTQHATTNWKIDAIDYSFCECKTFTKDSDVVSATINEWAMSYDADKRRHLVNTFFDVIYKAGFSDWVDFKADPIGKTQAILEEIGDLDPDVRREILFAVGKMATTFGSNVAGQF